ncbi:MAG: type IV pilus assembly protein PilM [bacterium]|nr:type IV pilus assembly protein PilM [bacterium]
MDIGTHSIHLAQMEMGKAGPRIVSLVEEPLGLEAGLNENERFQAVARKVQDMLKRVHSRTKNAVFSVPGQSVFVRRIKLPRTTPDRMERIIRFEARQQIPFPLDKTIMEYQIFDDATSPEVNVLLVAIKRDYIMNFMKMVRRTGLRPVSISVSTLALYNFHELNNSGRDLIAKPAAKAAAKEKPQKGKKGKKGEPEPEAEVEGEGEEAIESMGFEEIKAYINLGASLMDLAIPKPGREQMIGFPRSVPLAGNDMDRAIRDKLAIEDLGRARQIKEERAVVLATDFELEGDPNHVDMDASEAVTGVADRLISEMRRSLDFYISQPDGVAVDSLVISGGLARLRYLDKYIEEKMGLPVEKVALKHPQIRPPETMPEDFSPFAVAVGLAMQGLQLAQNKIDFLPEDYKIVRGMKERKFEVIGLVVMLLLIIGLSVDVGSNYIAAYRNQAEQYEQFRNESQKINNEITEAQKRDTAIAKAYQQLAKAVGQRDFWFNFLNTVHQNRPADVMIDDIYLYIDGNVVIKGASPSQTSINQFVTDLGAAKELISSVKFLDISTRPKTDARFRTGVYDFTLLVRTMIRKGRVRPIGEPPLEPTPIGGATR